jgi:hypothetical protein
MGSKFSKTSCKKFPPTRSYACIARGLVIELDFALNGTGRRLSVHKPCAFAVGSRVLEESGGVLLEKLGSISSRSINSRITASCPLPATALIPRTSVFPAHARQGRAAGYEDWGCSTKSWLRKCNV